MGSKMEPIILIDGDLAQLAQTIPYDRTAVAKAEQTLRIP